MNGNKLGIRKHGYRLVILLAVTFSLFFTIHSFNDVYADGTVKSFQKITEGVGGFTGDLDVTDIFSPVASIGDLDGDGVNDIAVGAPGDDDAPSAGINEGAVYILFMNTDGTVKSFQKITEGVGGFTGDLDDADVFGTSVAGIGDLDGDGIEDIAVGAPGDDDGGDGRGAVWILFLDADGTVDDANTDGTKISDTAGEFTGVLDADDRFGETVTKIGDQNGDGVNDIAVGASRDDDAVGDAGAVWLLFMDANGTVDDVDTDGVKITEGAGGFTGDLDASDFFGGGLSSILGPNAGTIAAVDIDGDNIEDLIVGAPGDDDAASAAGAVYILFLGEGVSGKSGGYHCSDCSPPSLGIDKNGRKVVSFGFSYNGSPTEVEYTYTPYPLITVNVGQQNVAKLVIHEDRGPEHLSHVALSFGLKEGQHLGDSKTAIIWDRNFLGEETISTMDPENSIDKESLKIQSSKTKCLVSSQDEFCTKLEIFHKFRAPLDFDIVGVTMWDGKRNSWQNTFNHGVHVQGKSLNPPAEYTVLDKRNLITITEIGKNTAVDENGYLWVYDKSWQKEFIPTGKIDDGVTMHLFDRNHARFDTYKQGQELLAKEVVAKLCPKCKDESFVEINDIKLSPYTNVKDTPRIDENLQKRIGDEIIKAEQKYHDIYDVLDRNTDKSEIMHYTVSL